MVLKLHGIMQCAVIPEFGIRGLAFVLDLLDFKESSLSEQEEGDVSFLFKTLDSLETLERNISERIIVGLPSKYIVVSFARQSLGGKKTIADSRRTWFEKILEKNNYEFKIFQVQNETFYVVSKE